MIEHNPAQGKRVSYQQPPVARGRVFFAAHDCDAVLGRPVFQPPQSFDKRGRFGNPRVRHVAVGIVELRVVRLPAHLLPEEEILNPGRSHGVAQRFRVELAGVFRVGMRADVHQDRDAMLREQA